MVKLCVILGRNKKVVIENIFYSAYFFFCRASVEKGCFSQRKLQARLVNFLGNSSKYLRKIWHPSYKNLLQRVKKECLFNLYYEACKTLISKKWHYKKRKQRTNLSHEHKWKITQIQNQEIKSSNIYKNTYKIHHNKVCPILGIQGWFNIQKSINA